jgi:ADP-heptose:LPS heptosyltransferase
MVKFYIATKGGVGDMVRKYFKGQEGWKYIQRAKYRYPSCKIKLITACSNPIGHEVFRYHPKIDEIEALPWQNPNLSWSNIENSTSGFKDISKANIQEQLPNKVFLSEEDNLQLKTYIPKEEFLVVHPFLANERRCISVENINHLVLRLADILDNPIIVLGGDNKKIRNKNYNKNNNEEIDLEHKSIINLVNKTNLRVGFAITQRAKFLIGMQSCFFGARRGMRLPALAFNNYKQSIEQVELYNRHEKSWVFATTGRTTQEEAIDRAIKRTVKMMRK